MTGVPNAAGGGVQHIVRLRPDIRSAAAPDMTAAIPELLLDVFAGPSGVVMVAAVLTVCSTARILWSPSNGQLSVELSSEGGMDNTPTKAGRRRVKLSHGHYDDDYEMRPKKPSPAAKRRMPVFIAALDTEEDEPAHRAYGRARGTLKYYALLCALVYFGLFLPTANRLPLVLDLSWAGLSAPHPLLSSARPSGHQTAEDLHAQAPLINDVTAAKPAKEESIRAFSRWARPSIQQPAAPVATEEKKGEEPARVTARDCTSDSLRALAEAAMEVLSQTRAARQDKRILGSLAPVQPIYRVERPLEGVLRVDRVYNASDVALGNRCFYEHEGTDCLPFYMVVKRNGRLQVREGREVGKGRVRWSPRRRANLDWARRISGNRQWFELKLTEAGVLELRNGKGQLRWHSSTQGGPADQGYEAFVDDEGGLVIFLRDELQWRSQ